MLNILISNAPTPTQGELIMLSLPSFKQSVDFISGSALKWAICYIYVHIKCTYIRLLKQLFLISNNKNTSVFFKCMRQLLTSFMYYVHIYLQEDRNHLITLSIIVASYNIHKQHTLSRFCLAFCSLIFFQIIW